MKNILPLTVVMGLALSAGTLAAPVKIALPEPEQTLRPGPGAEITTSTCQGCHSLDYIQTQPPHMGAAFWNAEVQKMIKTFGAPISEADAKTIADYLAQTY